MKNILILIILFSFISVDAQKQTKKYNSLQDRYEYYNAKGQMTGYEVYNSLQEQWEYYSVKTSSSSNKYGEPISTFDADLAFKVLQAKQNRYDNEKAVAEKNIARLSQLKKDIGEHMNKINNEKRDQVIALYDKKYSNYFDRNFPDRYAFSHTMKSFDLTTAMLNRMVALYNSSYKEVMSKPEYKKSSTKRKSEKHVPKFKYGDYVEAYSYSIIRSEPNTNSKEIGKVENDFVKVLSNSNEKFYKVESGSVVGYISTTWLKNKLESKEINDYKAKARNSDANNYNNSDNSMTTTKTSSSSSLTSEQKAKNHFKKAEEFLKKNDIYGALEQYNLSIEASPNFVKSYYSRAYIYFYHIIDYENVLADLTKAIQVKPDFESAYYYRGRAHKNLGNYIEAIEDLTKAIKLNRDNIDAYYFRGLSKQYLKQYQESIEDFNKIIEINPNDKRGYFGRGWNKKQLGYLNGAILDYNKAIKIDHQDASIFKYRGYAKSSLENFKGAIEDFNKAIEINPKDPHSFHNRGLARQKLGDIKGACTDWNKAIKLGNDEANEAINQYCN